jgi:hypothetical protein
MRFSLRKLLVVVALIALGCAGLMYRTAGWGSILVSFTIALYAIMILRAVGQRAGPHAFSLGFAVAGVAYLLLASCSFFGGLRESLVTNYPLALAAQSIAANNSEFLTPSVSLTGRNSYTGVTTIVGSNTLTLSNTPSISSLESLVSTAMSARGSDTPVGRFFLIGHCFWSWLFAWLAGWIAERRYVRRQEVASSISTRCVVEKIGQ